MYSCVAVPLQPLVCLICAQRKEHEEEKQKKLTNQHKRWEKAEEKYEELVTERLEKMQRLKQVCSAIIKHLPRSPPFIFGGSELLCPMLHFLGGGINPIYSLLSSTPHCLRATLSSGCQWNGVELRNLWSVRLAKSV